MAFEEDVLDVAFSAYADLSAYQYHFVKLTADNEVTVCSGATDAAIGILQNKPNAAGAVARVRVMGVSRVFTGTAGLVRALFVGTDASGHAVAKVANTNRVLGVSTATSSTLEAGTMIVFPPRTLYV